LPPNAITGVLGLGAQGSLNDSPTITYSPLSGERFARQMMGPILYHGDRPRRRTAVT